MTLDEFYEKLDDGGYRQDWWDNYGLAAKADFLKVHGIQEHPKADRLWSIAWEERRNDSISDVVYLAENLLDLIR